MKVKCLRGSLPCGITIGGYLVGGRVSLFATLDPLRFSPVLGLVSEQFEIGVAD